MPLKDSQVDLCGQLGFAGADSFPALMPGQAFQFACAGCGDCCRGREDIVLSGYDLWRLCARLQLPPRIVVQAFCRQYMGEESRLPVVRLRPLKKEGNNCPFLHNSSCTVHDAKPLVCALYPLGQQIETDGTVRYYMQPTQCGGKVHRAVLEDYLDRYDIRAREPLDVLWAQECTELSKACKQLELLLGPVRIRMVQRRIWHVLYLDYTYDEPFLPQFQANLIRIKALIRRLEADNPQSNGR